MSTVISQSFTKELHRYHYTVYFLCAASNVGQALSGCLLFLPGHSYLVVQLAAVPIDNVEQSFQKSELAVAS